jgi:hypothetical protein
MALGGKNYNVSFTYNQALDQHLSKNLCLVLNYRKHLFIGFLYNSIDDTFEIFDYFTHTNKYGLHIDH